MQDLIEPLEKISGQRFSLDKLKKVVSLSRECSELWRQVLETATTRPSPLMTHPTPGAAPGRTPPSTTRAAPANPPRHSRLPSHMGRVTIPRVRITLDLDDDVIVALRARHPDLTDAQAVELAIGRYVTQTASAALRALAGSLEIEDVSAEARARDRRS